MAAERANEHPDGRRVAENDPELVSAGLEKETRVPGETRVRVPDEVERFVQTLGETAQVRDEREANMQLVGGEKLFRSKRWMDVASLEQQIAGAVHSGTTMQTKLRRPNLIKIYLVVAGVLLLLLGSRMAMLAAGLRSRRHGDRRTFDDGEPSRPGTRIGFDDLACASRHRNHGSRA